MEFELTRLQDIDPTNGTWFTAYDSEGMEVEVTVPNLTPSLLATRLGVVTGAAGLLDVMITVYLGMPAHLRPGGEWLLITAVKRVHGLTGHAADEWLAEELQERYANHAD
jgi:hypothetical protein